MQLKVKVRACTQLSHSLVLQGVYVSRTRLRSIKVLSALGTYFINSRVGSMEMVFPKWCISCSTHRERALAVRLDLAKLLDRCSYMHDVQTVTRRLCDKIQQ